MNVSSRQTSVTVFSVGIHSPSDELVVEVSLRYVAESRRAVDLHSHTGTRTESDIENTSVYMVQFMLPVNSLCTIC